MNLKSYMRGIGIGMMVTVAIFLIAGAGKKQTMTDAEVKARARELGMKDDVTFVSDVAEGDKDGAAISGSVDKESDVEKTSDEKVTPEIEVIPTGETDKASADEKDEGEVTKEVTPTPTPTKEPTKEVTPTPSPTKEATPTPTPTKEVAPTPTPTKEVTPTPTPTKEATPTPTPTKEPEGDDKSIIIVVNSGDGSGTVARKLYEAGLVANANEYDQYLMANGYDKTITVGNHVISVTATKEEIAKNLVSPTR